MKFKAVIFDFDGLMFNTEKIWQNYFVKANEVFNMNFTEQDRIGFIGKNEQTIRKFLKERYPSLDVDNYRDWIRNKVHYHFKNLKVEQKKGLTNLLEFIESNKLLTGIASGAESFTILNMLNKAQINKNIFSSFATGDLKILPKPNPDVFLKVCTDLEVAPNEAIVLEDSYNGVIAGKKAGCFTIMIPDTMPVTQEMQQTADLILNDLDEVVEFLKNNN